MSLVDEAYENMVKDINEGEILIANFDSGLTIAVDYEKLSLTDMDEEDGFDIILSGETLDMLYVLLTVRNEAKEQRMSINWDELLNAFE